MAAFPGALATFAGFVASHALSQDNHAAQHNLEQAEVLAVQTKVGTGSSTPANNLVLTGTGAGTSAWSQVNLTTMVTGVLPQANGGTGTTSATGTGSTVYQTSPTITTPTIASFTNSQHDHSNAAGGGQLGSSALVAGAVTVDKLTASYVRSVLSGSFTTSVTVAYQDTGLKVTLPTAGTWIVRANLRVAAPPNANDYASVRLYNETTATAVTDSERIAFYPTGGSQVTIPIDEIITTATINNIVRVEMIPQGGGARTAGLSNNSDGKCVLMAYRIG